MPGYEEMPYPGKKTALLTDDAGIYQNSRRNEYRHKKIHFHIIFSDIVHKTSLLFGMLRSYILGRHKCYRFISGLYFRNKQDNRIEDCRRKMAHFQDTALKDDSINNKGRKHCICGPGKKYILSQSSLNRPASAQPADKARAETT